MGVKAAGPEDLTSTSFAILGHLALRPWSAYELTKSLRRSLHWFWPRAESRIYEQAARLVRLGLATSRSERTGRRRRTVYAVTPAGRRALAGWLSTAPTGFAYQSEPLLRVHLAAFGTKEQALLAVDEASRTAEAIFRDGVEIATMYAEGRHPLQSDAHIRALVFDHLFALASAIHGWAERTRAELEGWHDLEPDADKIEVGVRRMCALADRIPQG